MLFLMFGAAWACAVGGGLLSLGRYDATAGPAATPPITWPARADSAAPALTAAGTPTLLMFVHPRCPCSRASLAELAEVLARVPGRADVRILMTRPDGTDAAWERTPTRDLAARIPGATVETDVAGAAAARFGAATSGQVLLYAADGGLAFAGGITGGRGHAGDNPGRRALESALENLGRQESRSTSASSNATAHASAASAVYGCQLATPVAICRVAHPKCLPGVPAASCAAFPELDSTSR